MASQDPVQLQIADLVKSAPVVLFMKGNPQAPQCGFSAQVTGILGELLDDYKTVDVLSNGDVRQGIKEFSNWPTIPQLYIDGEFIGGCDIIIEMASSGELHTALGFELPDVAQPNITISDAAGEVFRDAPVAEGNVIRLSINKAFQYELGVGPLSEHDFSIESGGVTLAIDRMSAARADGLEIDYVNEGAQSGFKMSNPNEAAS
jgi:monothiol glutaredoxin